MEQEKLEQLETLNTLLRDLRGIDNNFYIVGSGNDYYIHVQGITCNIGHGTFTELKTYLKALKKTRLVFNKEKLEECLYTCGMATSILAYYSHTVDTVVNNEYMKKYKISENSKRVIAQYLINQIESNKKYVGTDSEGNVYNNLTYKS